MCVRAMRNSAIRLHTSHRHHNRSSQIEHLIIIDDWMSHSYFNVQKLRFSDVIEFSTLIN